MSEAWIWRPTIRGPLVTCARCGAPATGVDPDRADRQAAHECEGKR